MISDKGFRVMKNIPEEFAPSVEEKQLWAATKKVQLDENGEVVATPGKVSTEGGGDTANPGDQPGTPDGQPGDVSEGTNLPASAARFQGAAEMAFMRCRDLAGSRLRSRRKICPHCLEGVEHLPNTLIASGLGRAGLEPLGAPDPRELVAGGADMFKTLLMQWSYDESEASDICRFLELHAAKTLFVQHPPMPNFHVALS